MRVLDTSDALESTDCTNCTGSGTDIIEGTFTCTIMIVNFDYFLYTIIVNFIITLQ